MVLMLLLRARDLCGIPDTSADRYRVPLRSGSQTVGAGVSGAWVENWVGGHANPLFLAIWLAVIILLVILLALAFFDWLATRRYAHRQRSSIAQRLEILRETFRRRDALRNGHPPEPGKNGARGTIPKSHLGNIRPDACRPYGFSAAIRALRRGASKTAFPRGAWERDQKLFCLSLRVFSTVSI